MEILMTRLLWIVPGLLGALLISNSPALACSLCLPNAQASLSLRQDFAQAKLVLYGTVTNPRLAPGAGSGTIDLQIERVLKDNPALANRKVVTISKYVPVDPRNPPKFLVFCNINGDRLDAYRGAAVKSPAVVDYLRGAAALDGRDHTQLLQYCFRYLDSTDADVSNDAFLEFFKASDAEIGQVGSKLSAAKLRSWLQDAKTPNERLGVYAFMLGACGGREDAALLRSMVEKPTERTVRHLAGLLAGYIHLQPEEGWKKLHAMLRDARRPFAERYASLGALRFYHGWKPTETRRDVLRGLAPLIEQGDMADLAIEDLRKWQIWDLTAEVLAQYGKKSHDAPILKRAMLRYALCCPRPEAVRFLNEVRGTKDGANLIKEVEESLQFEKK
jgi:hypothetical protein